MMAAAPPQDLTISKDPRIGEFEAPASAQDIPRHDEFRTTDEMMVFQVENRLFRVHKHLLAENSLVFSSTSSHPHGASTDSTTAIESSSDGNPIFLPGATELEFETLLRYFYDGMHDDFSLPQPCWIALLSIAYRYEFPDLRERAIREIYGPLQQLDSEELTVLEQDHQLLVSVAEKYGVPSRNILPSLAMLVARKEPLTEVEVARFSALTVSRLVRAREELVRIFDVRMPLSIRTEVLDMPDYLLNWKVTVAENIVRKIWPMQHEESRRATNEKS